MPPIPRRVRDIMTRDVRTIEPGTPVGEAYGLMLEHGFRHLVVVDHGKVVGMLSDRDVLKHMPPPSRASAAEQGRFASTPVRKMMSATVFSIEGAEPIETAVDLMLAEHISALVVTDPAERLEGVVTLVDLAKLLGWLIRGLPIG